MAVLNLHLASEVASPPPLQDPGKFNNFTTVIHAGIIFLFSVLWSAPCHTVISSQHSCCLFFLLTMRTCMLQPTRDCVNSQLVWPTYNLHISKWAVKCLPLLSLNLIDKGVLKRARVLPSTATEKKCHGLQVWWGRRWEPQRLWQQV